MKDDWNRSADWSHLHSTYEHGWRAKLREFPTLILAWIVVAGVLALGYFVTWWLAALLIFGLPLLWYLFGPTDRR